MYTFGGYGEAERHVVGCSPFPLTDEDFPIVCLKLEVKTGLGKPLSHRDYLGALLGLGIERNTIGDIIVKSFGAYVLAEEKMVDYIETSLTGIGHYQKIEMTRIAFNEIETEAPKLKQITTTVASLRLDALLAAVLPLSRSKAVKLIELGQVKCNGMAVSATYAPKEGEAVTVRGYGKMRLKEINGTTKKDRLHITVEKYI